MSSDALVCRAEKGGEPFGWVVVDSAVGGRSCGGLRMLPDVSEEELRLLARAMTLKFGLLGLPQGGAKAGVRFDPEAPEQERAARLEQFGRAIRPLLCSRLYLPFADMGTDNQAIRRMLRAVGAPVRRRELRGERSGFWTACGVFAAARRACRHLGWALEGRTAAVEGFGKVGGALARLLAAAGVRVTAVATSRGALFDPRGLDVDRLSRLAGRAGSALVEEYREADRLPRERLVEAPADILAPCARHHSIHAGNAGSVRARLIVPGANVPLTAEAEGELEARGVLCLPDFLANAGGVLGGTMEFAGLPGARIRRLLDGALERLAGWLLEESAARRCCLRPLAEAAALARHAEVRRRAESPGWSGRLFEAGLELYRRGLIPAVLVGRLAPLYFRRLARPPAAAG